MTTESTTAPLVTLAAIEAAAEVLRGVNTEVQRRNMPNSGILARRGGPEPRNGLPKPVHLQRNLGFRRSV